MGGRAFWISVLACASVTAVISVLPFFDLINLCFFPWILLGGFVSVVIYQNLLSAKLTNKQAATNGAIMGLIAAILVAVLVSVVGKFGFWDALSLYLYWDSAYETPPLIGLLLNFFAYPLFGFLGGLLAVTLTKSTKQKSR